jgi:hypothetical protein
MVKKLFNRYDCVYCGMPCDTRDHVSPVSRDYTSRKNVPTNQKNTVPSCRECNNLLGARLFLTIGDRASYLFSVYRTRLDKILGMPSWSKEELKSIKGRMRQYVKNSLKKKESAKSKMKHIELVMGLCPTIDEVWEIINSDNHDFLQSNFDRTENLGTKK